MERNTIHTVVSVIQITLFLSVVFTGLILIDYNENSQLNTSLPILVPFIYFLLPLVLSSITFSQVILLQRQESVQLLRKPYLFLELAKVLFCFSNLVAMAAYTVLLPVYVLFWAKFIILRQASVDWSSFNLNKELSLKIRLALGGSLLMAYLLVVGFVYFLVNTTALARMGSSLVVAIYANENHSVAGGFYAGTGFAFLALLYGSIGTIGIFFLFFLNIESKRIVFRSLSKSTLDDTHDRLY